MTEYVALNASIQVSGIDREQLTGVFHGMGDVLTELEETTDELLDHAVSIDLGTGVIELDITAAGDTAEVADLASRAAIALAMIRTGGKFDGMDSILEFVDSLGEVAQVAAFDEPQRQEAQTERITKLTHDLESAGVTVTSRELIDV